MYLKQEAYRQDLETAWRGIVNREKLGGKRILITGATGLIGSFLTDLLLYANQAYGMGMDVFILARDEKSGLRQAWERKVFTVSFRT